MSRIFTDEELLTWEAYASGGKYGLPTRPKIIFQCISRPGSRARYMVHQGDESDAEQLVHTAAEDQLRALLRESSELD